MQQEGTIKYSTRIFLFLCVVRDSSEDVCHLFYKKGKLEEEKFLRLHVAELLTIYECYLSADNIFNKSDILT